MMTRWITGQQEHDWFPEPCYIYSSLEVDDGGLTRKNDWIGPFTLDQAVVALWQARRWNVTCSVTIDDGTGPEPFGSNGTFTAQWNPSLANETYLNEVDLDFRFVQPTSGGLVALFLSRNAIGARHPSRVIYYDGGDGHETPGYYIGGLIAVEGAATGGYSYSTATYAGIQISWSLGSEGSVLIPMYKDGFDTNSYSGFLAISPQAYWPY